VASHRRFPQPGLAARSTRVTVLSAAAAATAALSGGTAQKYDAAQERAKQLRADLNALQDRAAKGQSHVNALRDELGVLAASQYREGGIDPSLALLLSDDPDGYLDRAADLHRLGGQELGRLQQLQEAERQLVQQRGQAADKLAELQKAGTVLRDRKQAVQRSLAEAQRILNAMPAGQRAGYTPGQGERASRDRTEPEIANLPASSGRAAMAVAAAERMVGAPYVWGATGPNAFDCSGLMLYAYQQAGVSLPRTSQEQLDAGTRVPLDQARPGDLVIYRGDASHVGMYVGGGQVVHAPYPGARVRYDPVGMMPITAVTRPA
jgi:cell wall-associated NlpC family hydrolase